jgi:hypothetical protein
VGQDASGSLGGDVSGQLEGAVMSDALPSQSLNTLAYSGKNRSNQFRMRPFTCVRLADTFSRRFITSFYQSALYIVNLHNLLLGKPRITA